MTARQVPWNPEKSREAEAATIGVLTLASPASDHVIFSGEAGGQFALRNAYVTEACMYAIDRAFPRDLVGEATVDGMLGILTLSQVTDGPIVFGGRESDAVKILKGVDAKTVSEVSLSPEQALSLYYLANARALRKWAHTARPTDEHPQIALVSSPEGGGPPATQPTGIPVPQLPSTVPAGGIPFPFPVPVGGNIPGTPGFDPSKPVVLPGPPPGFGGGLAAVTMGNVLLLGGILVGVLGAAGIAAYAWFKGQEVEANKAVKISETETLTKAHVATELALKSLAAGQPVSVPDVIRTLGAAELAERRLKPYVVGGAATAAAVALFFVARAKGWL